jgi:hypothetical protein
MLRASLGAALAGLDTLIARLGKTHRPGLAVELPHSSIFPPTHKAYLAPTHSSPHQILNREQRTRVYFFTKEKNGFCAI